MYGEDVAHALWYLLGSAQLAGQLGAVWPPWTYMLPEMKYAQLENWA